MIEVLVCISFYPIRLFCGESPKKLALATWLVILEPDDVILSNKSKWTHP